VKLYQASSSKILRTKQEAMVYYKNKIGISMDEQHESIFMNVARKSGVYPPYRKISFYMMTELEVDLHILAAQHLLNSEIRMRSYDTEKYAKAEKILFSPERTFTRDQVLHTNERNETLTVEDMLRVAKYSIAFAELMHPEDKNKELASASITIFQCIEATLNNQNRAMPISKKLHIANGFLATVVKANIKDTDTKRGITIAATLIDLVIDFFAGK
jgi:hypothetical protein